MVTSNKSLENKAVTMSESNAGSGGPPRTLLGEVNPHLSCVLCRGYYIDATTIVECLHSFCRSCIIKHLKSKSYCPVCEMMINSARPNIKPDKALQDIVYKLVPGLFQKEMERRQQFYASNPATAASATPEQRGDDRERLIFSPEDVISFSLEYVDTTEMESTSSKSSESGSDSSNTAGKATRRFLQCPAVVNISHLKKFLSNKLDVDLSQFCIDILYKNLTLPDYYTLMDVAYIYNWKKIEPMRFFYQIIDYAALRNRFGLFGMNRPAHLRKRKLGPNSGIVSLGHPLHNLLDPTSDASSGGNSPLPEEAASPPVLEISHQPDTESDTTKVMRDGRLRSSKVLESDRPAPSTSKNAAPQPDEEKSQFLNSFELTAKSKLSPSPVKNPSSISTASPNNSKGETKSNSSPQSKTESPAKRKLNLETDTNETKKPKMESPTKKEVKPAPVPPKRNEEKLSSTPSKPAVTTETKETKPSNRGQTVGTPVKDSVPTQHGSPKVIPKNSQKMSEEKLASINEQIMAQRRQISAAITANQLAKSKLASEANLQHFAVKPSPSTTQKPSAPLLKPNDKPTLHLPKKPEFKPSISTTNEMQTKSQTPTNKPAPKQETTADNKIDPKSGNNSRPSLKTMLSAPTQTSGDPLKSLFDSCNINIPSSLSITLSDQKIEQKPPEQQPTAEQKNKPHKPLPGASMSSAFNNPVKTPSPPVHNYIEIVKLPEVESSKTPTKTDNTKPPGAASNNKSGDTPPVSSAKGPMPNLKPISSTKGGKTVTFAKPQTFQQTFLQSLEKQNDKKVIKTKLPPGLKPAPGTSPGPETEPSPVAAPPNLNPPKTAMSSPTGPVAVEKPKLLPNLLKTDSALDLSTPHIPLNHTLQHTKALETMQSIANLAKKQNCLPHRSALPTQSFSQNNAKNSQIHLRIPVPTNQPKPPLSGSPLHPSSNSPRHLPEYYHPLKGPGRGNSSPVQSAKASAPLIPTRSPSSSPKLVIACPSPKSHSPEVKQLVSPKISENTSQSNQISSSQITSTNATGAELSKELQKPAKHSASAPGPSSKLSNVRLTTPKASGELHHNLPQQVLAQQAFMRQLDYQNQINLLHGASAQWLQMSNNNMARAHFENFVKNMAHNGQNPYGNLHKDKP